MFKLCHNRKMLWDTFVRLFWSCLLIFHPHPAVYLLFFHTGTEVKKYLLGNIQNNSLISKYSLSELWKVWIIFFFQILSTMQNIWHNTVKNYLKLLLSFFKRVEETLFCTFVPVCCCWLLKIQTRARRPFIIWPDDIWWFVTKQPTQQGPNL